MPPREMLNSGPQLLLSSYIGKLFLGTDLNKMPLAYNLLLNSWPTRWFVLLPDPLASASRHYLVNVSNPQGRR